jgi:hypothetical protein
MNGVAAMKWLEIVRFELVYQLKRRTTWIVFAGVLAMAAGRRGIEDIPVASLSALGAVLGLVPGGFGVVALTGDAFPTPWVLGSTTLLGAAAAAASGLLFRYLARRHAPEGAEASS